MRYKSVKRDENHGEVKEAFEKCGFTVFDAAAMGRGFPDLVVGRHGQTWLVEVKTAAGKLEDSQERFKLWWAGSLFFVRSEAEVVALANKLP